MKEILDIEAQGSNIKSKCVRIANEFNTSRPDHEFTRWFNEIQAHIYNQHERLLKSLVEVERLKKQLSEINSDDDMEFEESTETVSARNFEPITDDEYLKKPLQNKMFDKEETPF